MHHYIPKFPIWIDECLKKAVSIDPEKRYSVLTEFLIDLEKPNKKFLHKKSTPLIQKDPVKFWKWISFIQLLLIIALVTR